MTALALRPSAHYDLLFRDDPERPEPRLVQTSFFGGDVEKREAGLDDPAQRVGLPCLFRLAEIAADLGLSPRSLLKAGGLDPRLVPMAGAAEIFPDEGLDVLLNQQPRNSSQAIVDPTYLGLFTSQTSSTVPGRTAVLATQTGVTEVANAGAYARVAVNGGAGAQDWGAIATSGNGRRTTAAQKSLPESTASWGTVNGFLCATTSGHGTGKAFFYANFDDLQPVVVNAAGYTLRVTPFWQIDG